MSNDEIDKLLTGENNEALAAHSEIVSIQKDKSNIIKFGMPWLDEKLVGGLNNKMVFLGSRPSGGKTYHCSSTIRNLLNKEINPTPIKILRLNLEVPTQTLLLQETAKALNKTPAEILAQPYLESERDVVSKVVASFMDKRITNVSNALTGENFKYLIERFLQEVDKNDAEINEKLLLEYLPENVAEAEKEERMKKFVPYATKKIVLLDHLHIHRSKEVIDTLLLICNDLKMTDKNLSFVFYFQLNRLVEDLWRESKEKKINPKNMMPNSTFIYLTDVLQQVADVVVGMVIPQNYDLEEYAAIHKERNIHLQEHFIDNDGDNVFSRLKGRNRIYYNFMKIRIVNSFDDPRVYCEILNPEYEKTAEKLYEQSKQPFIKSVGAMPVFSEQIIQIDKPVEKTISDMSLAFDINPNPEDKGPF